MAFGAAALRELGIPDDEIVEVSRDVRRRDAERLQMQVTGGLTAGRSLLHNNRWAPAPLTQPLQTGQALNDEAAQAIEPPAT
jgi:glutathione-regulated potassium-efflux system protein KefB